MGTFFREKEGGKEGRPRKKKRAVHRQPLVRGIQCCLLYCAAHAFLRLSRDRRNHYLHCPTNVVKCVFLQKHHLCCCLYGGFLQHDLDPYTIVSLNNNLAILSVGLCRFSSALFPLPFFRRRRRFRPLLSHQSRTRRQRRKRIGSKKKVARENASELTHFFFPLRLLFCLLPLSTKAKEEKPTNKMVRSCAFFLSSIPSLLLHRG